jgi:FkbM family methyltransferase
MQLLAGGTVLVVEPNPTIKPYLDMTCIANGHLGKFVTAGEAVTTEDTDSVTILDHCNALCNGGMIDPSWTPELQQRMEQMSGNSVTVPGLTLEHLCQKYLSQEEIDNISFIKTDTEGHDVSILESSKEFIDRTKPVLFIEWFFAFTEVESQHMFDVIESMDYLPFYPLTLKPASIAERSDDLVLIHKSKVSEYL